MLSGTVRTNEIGQLGRVLSASRARLVTAGVGIPGGKHLIFRQHVEDLYSRQIAIERELRDKAAQLQQQNLGVIWWAVIAGGAALSAIGAKVFQQHRATQEVEQRMEMYNELINNGYSPEDAGRIALGDDGGGIGDIMNKLILLSAIGTGLFLLIKLR